MNPIDISTYPIETWRYDDERLPKSEDLVRTPPEKEFIDSIRAYGQLESILMCHNDTDGWFIGDGSKRVLAIRALVEEEPERSRNIVVMIGEGISKADGELISIIKNAQRSENEFNNYVIIRRMLQRDKAATYKSIASQIHKPEAYIKATAQKYAKVPDWTMKAALDGKIVKSTALQIGKFKKNIQEECKKEFEENGKLSLRQADDKRKAITREIMVNLQPVMGFAVPTSQRKPFYPVEVLDNLYALLKESKYVQAKKMMEELLT